MRKLLLIALSVMALNTIAQDKGVGLRFGDLNGVTFKMYDDKTDLEFGFGNAQYIYDNFDYNNYFINDWYVNNPQPYTDIEYLNYSRSQPIAFHVRYLFHKDLNKIGEENVKNLVWYYGLGAQFRSRSIIYNYRYKVSADNNWYYNSTGKLRDIDLGAEGIVGLEYTFQEAPISIFADINLFLEIVDDPFSSWFQGGLGARYKF